MSEAVLPLHNRWIKIKNPGIHEQLAVEQTGQNENKE
jgi:hypothetical protein